MRTTNPAERVDHTFGSACRLLILVGTCLLQASSGFATVTWNPYENVNWTTFGQYKGNLHTHTRESDGQMYPDEKIDAYKNIGYSILSLTDHDTHTPATTTWPWTDFGRDPAQLGMVAIEGNEISRPHHTGSYFNDYGDPNQTSAEAAIVEIGNRNGLAVLFHPGRYNYPVNWYSDLYENYDHLIGMEVYNQGDRYPGDRGLWDQVLTQLMPHTPVWGFSNDDAHRAEHVGRNWQTFILDDLSESAVRDAMVAGHFYFSYAPGGHPQGGGDPAPVITAITVDQQAGTIAIDATGYTGISWVTSGIEVATGEVFDATNHQGYVRAELTGPTGKTYTQPFFAGDPDGGTPHPIPGISVEPADVLATIPFVHIGDPGNDPASADNTDHGRSAAYGSGAVDYEYKIGQHRVTNAQYAAFLNGVGSSTVDQLGLLHGNMEITYSFNENAYSAHADWENRPLQYVDWYNAARFCNWLTTGDPLDGVYQFDENGDFIGIDSARRHSGNLVYVLPTDDEWYKAAYYDPALHDGNGGYYLYGTGSDETPTAEAPPGSAVYNGVAGANSANYGGEPGYPTEAGAYEYASSPYGVYDMAGNVSDWNETLRTATRYGRRGGSFTHGADRMRASWIANADPTSTWDSLGFRVASVPEPGSVILLLCGAMAGLLWRRRRR